MDRFRGERHLPRMNTRSSTLTAEALVSHADFVRGLARSLLRDAHAAEDVAQETLVRALEHPPRSETTLRSWLATVTRNFARQRARRAGRRRSHELAAASPAEPLPSTADVLEREAIRAEVVQAVLALSEPQRTAVLLRYYEGRPPREIAARLGIPVETARTRIKRGLERMRRHLDARRGRHDWTNALLPLAGSWKPAGGALLPLLLASHGVKLAAAVIAVLAGVAWWVSRTPAGAARPEGVIATTSPLAGADRDVSEALVAPALEGRDAVAALATPAPFVVAGRALTPEGAPLPDEQVYLRPEGPLPAAGPGRVKFALAGADRGELRLAETDRDGSFRFELDGAAPVHVGLVRVADPMLQPGPGTWVEPPAHDLVLRAVPAPVAHLTVRARMRDTGRDVMGFTVVLHGSTTGSYRTVSTDRDRAEIVVPLSSGTASEEFDVTVEHPSLGRAGRRVGLSPGAREEVELLFDAVDVVAGVVVDELDRPVADALVCFGVQENLRGDEPFKPYRPERIRNGVRTGPDGAFELTGKGRWITAWHAELSPATVPASECERIVLRPRSVVAGTLLDAGGDPVSGATLLMDREREAVTDGAGRFRFEGVEAGIRGIHLPSAERPGDLGSARVFAVDVPPSATVDVELDAGLPKVTIELQQEELPYTLNVKDQAVVVGEGRVFSMQIAPVLRGEVRLEDVLPGDYWVLTASGLVSAARLDAARVAADVGTSALTVRAAPGRSLYVAPAGANELVWLMANRVAARRVPTSGALVFSPLPPGEYVVASEGEGELGRVRVDGPTAAIRID